jgi:hypothetical protein
VAAQKRRKCVGCRWRRMEDGRPRPGRPRRHGTGGWRARKGRRACGRDNGHKWPWPPPPGAAWRKPARHRGQRTTRFRGSGMWRLAARSGTEARDPGFAAGALAGRARCLVEYVACRSRPWSPWPYHLPTALTLCSLAQESNSLYRCMYRFLSRFSMAAKLGPDPREKSPNLRARGCRRSLAVQGSVGRQLPAPHEQLPTAREGI